MTLLWPPPLFKTTFFTHSFIHSFNSSVTKCLLSTYNIADSIGTGKYSSEQNKMSYPLEAYSLMEEITQ